MSVFCVQNGPLSEKNDAIASQTRRLLRLWCSLPNLCATVRQGYLHVACNSSMGQMRPVGCIGVIGNSRRLGCRIASKQLWPLAFSLLSQLVPNKKKLFTLKSQLWLSNQQLSTKIKTGRAFLPAPDFAAAHISGPTIAQRSSLFAGGWIC